MQEKITSEDLQELEKRGFLLYLGNILEYTFSFYKRLDGKMAEEIFVDLDGHNKPWPESTLYFEGDGRMETFKDFIESYGGDYAVIIDQKQEKNLLKWTIFINAEDPSIVPYI